MAQNNTNTNTAQAAAEPKPAKSKKPVRKGGVFKPVQLVSPKGRQVTVKSNRDLADLLGAGYKAPAAKKKGA